MYLSKYIPQIVEYDTCSMSHESSLRFCAEKKDLLNIQSVQTGVLNFYPWGYTLMIFAIIMPKGEIFARLMPPWIVCHQKLMSLLPSSAKVQTKLGWVCFNLSPEPTTPPDQPDSYLVSFWPCCQNKVAFILYVKTSKHLLNLILILCSAQ